jgi:hypothetical protein
MSDFIVIHFVSSTHPPIELVTSCKIVHMYKDITTTWLSWLKSNHVGYKSTTINT